MTDDARKAVRGASLVAGAIAVVLSPIPLADEIALLPVFGVMAARIGKGHGLAARDLPWKALSTTAFTALAARAAVNVTVSYIPGVAAVANAASAVALTHVLGAYVDDVCKDPASAHVLTFREVTEKMKAAVTRAARAPTAQPVPSTNGV
jgi:uncharacterized protein (DUF697 family)